MALRLPDDEIWKWYQIIKDQKKSGLAGMKYCKQHNIDYKKFANQRFRMFNIKDARPGEYKDMRKWSEKFLDSETPLTQFCRDNDVDRVKLMEMNTHVQYERVLARLKTEKGDETKEEEKPNMNFVQLKNPTTPKTFLAQPVQEHELVEAQNDIELKITKGVKVLISPQVDSMKIIKIIELLKDL